MSLHSLPKPGEVVDIGVVVRDAKDVLNGLYAVVLPSDLAEAGINLNDSCVHLRFKREPLYLDYAYVTLFRKDGTTLDTMVLSFAEPQAGSLRMLEQVVFFRDMKKAEWAFAPLTIVGLADKLESGAIGEVEVSFDGDGTARIDSRDGDNLRVAVRSNGTLPDGSLQLEFDGKRTLSVPVLMQFAPEEE